MSDIEIDNKVKCSDGVLYGQSMTLDNGEISVDGCVTVQEARQKCMDLAVQSGWKEPSWFEEHILGKKNYRKIFEQS